MASITIRNFDDDLKRRLRICAAEHGCSMEQEARDILKGALEHEFAGPENLADAIRDRFAKYGGVKLELPPREPVREPPSV